MKSETVKRGFSDNPDPRAAALEFAEMIRQDELAGVIFFCSTNFDLKIIQETLNHEFICPILGATTAGEVSDGYHKNSIVGISFSSKYFKIHTHLIQDIDQFSLPDAAKIATELESHLKFSSELSLKKMFGIFLIDGLSMAEEMVIGPLHNALKGVSVIGGSAGDALEFKETQIFSEGQFHTHAAVFALIETTLPFKLFQHQHFVPTETEMVITEALPAKRVVTEINGAPAAQEFAEITGYSIDELTTKVLVQNPLMLEVGGQWFLRSVSHITEQGGLKFFSAIDAGLPLSLGKSEGLIKTLDQKVSELKDEIPNIAITLGFDCFLRRLEFEGSTQQAEIESELNAIKFLGFNTYGEQFNGLHVNQTLTAVVIGEES